ncbi:type II secretion system protein GspM [Pseudomonas putida]|uniref:Type II secretion system protein GspM n=1 Tax=Pseudomonas putida TaxID=303 RepID=A0A1X0ZWM9_PSEPU|nr:type II secretion system protein GspM [Pseudomonas putida]MEB3899378.1 type II secretion system protein GspM [Pseudomonas putida]ORL64074.1 type II secretion system protein GspM [Pseudomonas putida]
MNLEGVRRYRMVLAWSLIASLLALLAGREGLALWRETNQWQALAAMAAGLRNGPTLSLERLRQSAQARGIELQDVQADDQTWQLQGLVADEQVLQGWLQAVQIDGAQPLQWGLERDAKGLRFALWLRP